MRRRAWFLWVGFLLLMMGACVSGQPEEDIGVVVEGLTATQQAKLTAADGAAQDTFGNSMALSANGSTAVVGASSDDVGNNANQGSVYVFTRSGTTWTQQAKLTAADGGAEDRFGHSVAVSADGSTVLVGAAHDTVGGIANHGSAYVFTRSVITWTQQAKLTAANGAQDVFGESVALSGDGSTAVVGARNDEVGNNAIQGSAYVFTRSGTTWTQQAKLTAPDGAAFDTFGQSVSVSANGSTAVVGAYNAYDASTGAIGRHGSAYVFTRSGTTWTQQARLKAADAAAQDNFGWSVAVSGDGSTAVVGAYSDDVGSNANQGSAYVFTRSGTTWTQQAKLTAPDGAASDFFGISVALSADGSTAVAGAFGDDVGSNAGQGSAYVFTRSGTTWTQQLKLTAADGAASDSFGRSVAVSADGSTLVVGANTSNVYQGSAYVFTLAKTNGSACVSGPSCPSGFCVDGVCCNTACSAGPCEACSVAAGAAVDGTCALLTNTACDDGTAKLTAADGSPGDFFGYSVAVSGDGSTVVVGVLFDDLGSNVNQGSAYVFTRSGTTWTQQAKLTAPDGAAQDGFGQSVAVSADGSTAVVGGPYDDLGSTANQGSAYVFTRSGTTWTQQAKLTALDGAAGDQLGWSVAVSADGSTAVAGAYQDDIGSNVNQGSAYVFRRSFTTWTQQAKLTAADGESAEFFGNSVAVSGDGSTAVVGAYVDSVGSNVNQGSAYVFTLSGTTWTQQAKLTAPDGAAQDNFGQSVAVSEDGSLAVVGASSDDLGSNANQGSAYVFTRSGTTWTQQVKLTAADGAANDFFGYSVALSGDGSTAVVGAVADSFGSNASQGSAYVFTRSGTTWTPHPKLTAADGAAFDILGFSVAVSADGSTAVAGAYQDDIGIKTDQGSAYVFTLAPPKSNGAACAAGPECASGFCADGVCCNTACSAGPCDACSAAAGAWMNGFCSLFTGQVCDDGDACTQADTCQSGVCTGQNPVVCTASDPCHTAGVCNPASGQCDNPAAANGTACNDGASCTLGDTCQSGTCAGGPLSTTGACTPVCVTIQRGTNGVVDDAIIDSIKTTQSWGASGSLTAGAVAGAEVQGLLRFDLSTIPANAFVISAGVTLNVCLAGGAPVDAHVITSPWSEATVTWSSFGGAYAPAAVATFPAATAPATTATSLLSTVQAWRSGATPNHGILLTRDLTARTVFCSSETGVALRPKLDVCYVPGN